MEYTVSAVANALGTNPVTVRRWITNGSLKASLHSNKSGYKIHEADLLRFLLKHPKYAHKASSSSLFRSNPSISIGQSAIEQILKEYGSISINNVDEVFDTAIKKLQKEATEKENELMILKGHLRALQTVQEILSHYTH